MKELVGKKQTKKVKFCGSQVEIKKLSIADVTELQAIIKKHSGAENQMPVLRDILRMAVVGAEDMTDEEFDTFSPNDLSDLSTEVLKYCGLDTEGEDKKGN